MARVIASAPMTRMPLRHSTRPPAASTRICASREHVGVCAQHAASNPRQSAIKLATKSYTYTQMYVCDMFIMLAENLGEEQLEDE